jgi:hypothetical protein
MWLPVIERAQTAADDEPKSTQLREVIVEFGRHLDILAEQLGASVMEADRDCVSVGDSFHEMASARATLESIECGEPVRSILRDSCLQIGESLQTAVVALQYHDRLSQRLGLVRVGLTRLQTLLHDSSPRSYDDWLASLRDVEQINRLEQQRLGPTPVETEASVYEPDLSQSSVELF